ncbi:syntaxin-8 [Anthonomus grandis grandis]|uniref:syntaxin-8 n=1 Tax=Anthonomus grandis grandis TaxID=2921223 RepID=UPI002165E792|nr:syntaxin-8 [Anthonomus grandis grandis]
MALIFIEDHPWILEHESCEKLQREIMGQLAERQKHPRTSTKHAQISADIRLRLKQYNTQLVQLRQMLDQSSGTSTITFAESERRTRQVEVLMTKATQMQKLFDDQLSSKRMEERGSLLGQNTDWEGAGGSSNMNIGDMRSKQKQMLGEQEKGLENLSKIISRQKDIANTITNEVDYHNEILDDIGTQVDQTDQRVRNETGRVATVDRKDNTCAYWIVIIILFISIIIVAVI